jgi:hypothetical protein
MPNQCSTLLISFACFALGSGALGAAVSDYGVLKVQQFSQYDSEGAPSPGFPAYAATAWVCTLQSNQLTAATLRLPSGATTNLPVCQNGARSKEGFDTPGALDARYPEGSYALTIRTTSNGERSVVLTLPAASYPPAPRIANYDEVQSWNANHNVMVQWDSFSGSTTNDAIQVIIQCFPDGDEVFRSPAPGQPGALAATATTCLIPANTLVPFRLYLFKVSFLRIPVRDTTSYPDAVGLAGYASTTEALFQTSGDMGGDVEQYWIFQGEFLTQTGPTTVVPFSDKPFLFEAGVRATGVNRVTGATLTLPDGTGRALALETNLTELRLSAWFASESALQNAFPPGDYVLTIQGFNDGETAISFNLPAHAFPDTPRLDNFTAAQAMHSDTNFVLRWDPFSGGTADDFIQFSIFDPDDGSRWIASPDLGEFDALDGTAASYELEAWTLWPNWTMLGKLRFLKLLTTDTTSYPGATGRVGCFAETGFQLQTVANLQPEPPFVLLGTQLPPATVSEEYSVLLQTESGVPPRSWSLVSGSLPPGLQLDPNLGGIWGIPAASGTFNFRVRVTDSATNAAEQSYSLEVTGEAKPLLITTLAPTNALPDIYYDGEIGYDGGAPPYRFTLLSGSLPPGVELNPETGLITGVPTASGDFGFIVQLTDGTGQTTNKALAITVPPPDEPPLKLEILTVPSLGLVNLRLTGNTNAIYTLETSSNLADWLPVLETNLESGNVFQVPARGSGPACFYRARLGVPEPVSNPMNVVPHLDLSRRVSAVFPLVTNSLSLTNAAGVIFTLEIPTNALAEATEISMTPIATLEGLPNGAQVLGAVQLDPDGLLLFQPATLTIQFPDDLPADVDCFAYRGWGRDMHRVLGGKTTGRTVRLPVFSFSGHGVGPIATISPGSKPCERFAFFEAAVADLLRSNWPNWPNPEDLRRIFMKAFREFVYPDLKAGAMDEKRFRAALVQFLRWLRAGALLGLQFEKEEAQGYVWVGRGFINAINKTHARCVNEKKPFLAFKLYEYARTAALLGFKNEVFSPELIDDRVVRLFRFEAVFESSITWQDCSGVGGVSYAQVRSDKCRLQFPWPMSSTSKGIVGILDGWSDLDLVAFYLPPHWAREMNYDVSTNAVYKLRDIDVGFCIPYLKFQRKKTDNGDKEEPACPTDFPEYKPSDYEVHCQIQVDSPVEVFVTDANGGLSFDPLKPDDWAKRFLIQHHSEWHPESFVEDCFGIRTVMYKFWLDCAKWELFEGELTARYKAEGVYRRLIDMGSRPALFREVTTLELRHTPKPFRGQAVPRPLAQTGPGTPQD